MICVERNLPSTYYCGEECMNAHWQNGHKEYHRKQKELSKERREGTEQEIARSLAEEVARRAEETGDDYHKRFAAALALSAGAPQGHGALRGWR